MQTSAVIIFTAVLFGYLLAESVNEFDESLYPLALLNGKRALYAGERPDSYPQLLQQSESDYLPRVIYILDHPCYGQPKFSGLCNSDWANAALRPIEFLQCAFGSAELVPLSEQQLVDCGTESRGCSGGTFIGAWNDIIKSGGVMPSSEYLSSSKWTGKEGKCKFDPTRALADVIGYDWVNVRYANHSNATEHALFKHGPLATTIYVNPEKFFQLKNGKLYYDDIICGGAEGKQPLQFNLIGYGTSQDDAPIWMAEGIDRISTGFYSFFLIRRGIDLCGIESRAAYVKIGLDPPFKTLQ